MSDFKFDVALSNLPSSPGVYIMHGENDEVIYVGKAKNLKNRVRQYFNSNVKTPKTVALVSHIQRFEYIITKTELEALILECNLIKKHLPKYNILLKDDKAYPYIKITNEPFPKVVLARKVYNDSSKYFGPYLNTNIVKEVLDTIKKLFLIRDCNRLLPQNTNKERACLNYSIKQCSAPCTAQISQEDYAASIKNAHKFLSGNFDEVLKDLQNEMQELSSNMEFERAAKIRDKIMAITKMREKQKATSVDLDNKDIIALCKNGNLAAIQVFFIRDGKVLGRENYFIKNLDGEENKNIIADFIKQYYSIATSIPRRIFIQEQIDDENLIAEYLTNLAGTKISLNVPQKGVNLDLLRMAETNAQEFLNLHQTLNNNYKKKTDNILFEIKDLLSLENAPIKIEVYDISNISGADNIGARIVFENALPVKKLYRIYNIKDLENYQVDDYSAMKEVLRRRFLRKDEDALPNLILIDGGKGHVSSIKQVAEEMNIEVPIFGLVKTEKHRTRGITTEEAEISIPITSKAFHFFTKIQDEVHRFAIKAHREKHKKSTFNSELKKIKGIGEVKQTELLKKFGSLENIKNAKEEELMQIKGITKELAAKIKSEL